MSKLKIFIDFDGCILDTSSFKERLFDAFFRMGYEMKDIKSSYVLENMDYKYNPKNHLKRLMEIKSTNLKLADARIESAFTAIQGLIYEDVESYFLEIDRKKYEPCILTLGELEYQRQKIDASGVAERVEKIYVTDKQKWLYLPEIVKSNEEFILIDDRADTLEEVKKKFPRSLCMQIIRQDLDFNDADMLYKEVYSGIKIKSLPEAIKYL